MINRTNINFGAKLTCTPLARMVGEEMASRMMPDGKQKFNDLLEGLTKQAAKIETADTIEITEVLGVVPHGNDTKIVNSEKPQLLVLKFDFNDLTRRLRATSISGSNLPDVEKPIGIDAGNLNLMEDTISAITQWMHNAGKELKSWEPIIKSKNEEIKAAGLSRMKNQF